MEIKEYLKEAIEDARKEIAVIEVQIGQLQTETKRWNDKVKRLSAERDASLEMLRDTFGQKQQLIGKIIQAQELINKL